MNLGTSNMPLFPVALVVEPNPRGLSVLASSQDASQQANLVNMHLWGALQDRAPHQTRLVQLRPELNVEMSPSSTSTAQSLA